MGYVKNYELGVTVAEKTKYVLEKSGMAQYELAKVLGTTQSEIHYIVGGYQPAYNVTQVIFKLYRLWYEKTEGVGDEAN